MENPVYAGVFIDWVEPGTAPQIKSTERVNTRTGEFFGQAPEGIDPGWNYNVGKAWIGSDVAFGQKLMQLPPVIRDQVLSNNQAHIKQLSKSWQVWLDERSASLPRICAHGWVPASQNYRCTGDAWRRAGRCRNCGI